MASGSEAANDITTLARSVVGLSDRDLLARVQKAASKERRATAELIVLLIELDERRLYLSEGCSSLFTYCTQILHLSEHAAYGRIEAARAARRFPTLLDRLAAGDINLTAIGLLAPHLTVANHVEVLDGAHGKSKREVEQLVAKLHPRADVLSAVRKLPNPKSAPADIQTESPVPVKRATTPSLAPTRPPTVKPLAPERYQIQFTVNRETYDRLRRVQDLLRHVVPNGDVAAIFERALALLFADVSRRKLGAAERPRGSRQPQRDSRYVPASVKRAVWQRDAGQCAFRGRQGRCTETAFLEFHHVMPFADGGETTTSNLELRCHAHNNYEAERWFGPRQPTLLRESRVVY